MTRIRLVLALVLFSAVFSALFSPAAMAHKAIILVRHAEKESQTDPDSAISIIGEDRALAFARLLRNAGVTHVFTSDKKRTQQTAQPLVDQKGLKITVATEVKDLVTQLKALPKDAVAVVVHHSNTVPEVLKALGVKGDFVIKDDQYGRVFVVGGDFGAVELAY